MLRTSNNVYENFEADLDMEKNFYSVPKEEQWRVQVITDIIDAKGGEQTISDFSREELDMMLQYACCT